MSVSKRRRFAKEVERQPGGRQRRFGELGVPRSPYRRRRSPGKPARYCQESQARRKQRSRGRRSGVAARPAAGGWAASSRYRLRSIDKDEARQDQLPGPQTRFHSWSIFRGSPKIVRHTTPGTLYSGPGRPISSMVSSSGVRYLSPRFGGASGPIGRHPRHRPPRWPMRCR